MPNPIKEDILKVDETSFSYILEQNVTVTPKTVTTGGLIRCNVFRPKVSDRVPVILTYGPYGKDTHASE